MSLLLLLNESPITPPPVVYDIAYTVNGTSVIGSIQAQWQRVIKYKSPGVVVFQDTALHIWTANLIAMDSFEYLKANQGRVLSSLVTTDITSPNDQAEYTGAEIVSVVAGQQVGRQVQGAKVEFRVKI